MYVATFFSVVTGAKPYTMLADEPLHVFLDRM
jgi:hypothetical protein